MFQDAAKLFTKFLHLEDPWKVSSVVINDEETRVDIRIVLKTIPEIICKCGCAMKCYDKREREWQHTDLFDMECHIHCQVPRMKCEKCGKLEMMDVPWASKGSGFTLLFESKSVDLMKEMPVNSASRYLRVTDKRLWRVLDSFVEKRMKEQDLSKLDSFYVDETACKRGHNYISIFVDKNHEIIFVTNGNDSSTMTRFREHLESCGGRADNIRYICCDMGKGFESGIAREFPKAIVTYDRFHVMEHMTLAVDKARRDEWNRLRHDGKTKEASDLKGQRFLLLRNNVNLDDDQKKRVQALMDSHEDVGTAYQLKESLRETWEFDNRYDAANHLVTWLVAAEHTGLNALKDIIRLVDNHFNEILNWFSSGMSNGVMEGINSVIQAVKGRARGYRNWENLRTMCYLRGSSLCI